MNVRVSRVFYPVTALGPGRRMGIGLQGCSIGCRGCMSRDTWSAADGTLTTIDELAARWVAARAEGATGLTISGGEPSEQPAALIALLRAVRTEGADILLYTGRELTAFAATVPEALGLVDALITGPYDIRRATTLIWRGSSNQDMHLLTRLGQERFGRYRDHTPQETPLQIMVDDETIWYVGVPRPGDLLRIERDLRAAGVDLGGSSWRP